MKIRPASILFAVAAATTALSAGTAQAQTVILKVHHFQPATANFPINFIEPWCAKIAKESADRLKCQIYPSMQLGGTPAQLFGQAKDGVADIVWTVGSYQAGRFTKTEAMELPFMTRTGKGSSQALWAYVHKDALDEYEGVKLIAVHFSDGVAFHFTEAQPKTMDDLKGLKVRASARTAAQMLSSLGATPVSMPLPAVPEAMSKGVIDGAAVPWEGVPVVKLQEIAHYHLDTPPGSRQAANSFLVFGMNQAKYDSLPTDLKKVIDDNSGPAVSARAGEVFDQAHDANRKMVIDSGGKVVYISDSELQRWMKATEPMTAAWLKEAAAKGLDGKKLLEDAHELLSQYDK